MKRKPIIHTVIYRALFSTAMSEKTSIADLDKNRVAFLILQVKDQFTQRQEELESRCGKSMANTILTGWKNQFIAMVMVFDKIYDGYVIDRDAERKALDLYYRYWNSTDVGFHDIGEEALVSLIN